MKKSKHFVNWRLLRNRLSSIDYDKLLKRKAYYNNKYNLLLLNYYWNDKLNKQDLVKIVKFSKSRCGANWYKVLVELGITDKNQNIKDFNNSIFNNTCKECGILISPNKCFCSVKCSNTNKSKNVEYKRKLSKTITTIHNNRSESKKEEICNKIKTSIDNYYANMSKEEIREICTNKNKRLTSFNNLKGRFPELRFLFSEYYYYRNRYLPVQCKICGFQWDMTKSTSISRTVCTKCYPHNKHKTQTKLFNYVNDVVPASQNVKNVINGELDIYAESKSFAIEYNGLLPHSYGKCKISYYNNFVIDKTYHLRKTEQCEELNIQLFHIFENEFINTKLKKIWLSVIDNKLGKSKKIYARKCIIRKIQYSESKQFLENNHLQGNCNSAVKLGLYYNSELISVMTFRRHKIYQWEIARFANACGYTVVGGASKLLRHFEREYQPTSIISYANRRWSCGSLYEKLGFKFIKNTKPNYFYFKPNENILYPREIFQKHKQKYILNTFDESLTEIQNMLNNDYRIIYDSGNKQYVKVYKQLSYND